MDDRSELQRQLKELIVLQSELASLKTTAKVYKQQPNSQVFFLDDRLTITTETNGRVATLKKKIEENENKSQVLNR